jgi:hypothetical protein
MPNSPYTQIKTNDVDMTGVEKNPSMRGSGRGYASTIRDEN